MRSAIQGKNSSLVLRLVRTAVLWALPGLLIAAIAMTWFYRSSALRIFDEEQGNIILALIAAAEPPEENTDKPLQSLTLARQPIDPRYQRALSGRYWLIGILSPNGKITPLRASYSMSGETLILPQGVTDELLGNPGPQQLARAEGPDKDQGEKLRLMARSVILRGTNGQPVVIVAGADVRPTERDIQRFAMLALGLMILLSTALVSAVFMQVRLGLKPLFELRGRVVDVREGRAERVEGSYPTEIAPLADELNTLIGHNRDIVERARTHVSNLAHALKTPLAVLQNESQSSKTSFGKMVQRQTKAMKTHIDHHLNRARAAARGQLIGVVTPLGETVLPLGRTLARIYPDKTLQFDYDVPEDLAFRGEKRDLEEMLGNLMDNACKWSGGIIKVSAGPSDLDESMMDIHVEDDGPGLKPGQYAVAMKRGQRLDETTPGTGFGLPIVEDMAKAYKGRLVLGRSGLGGLKASLILPRRL